MTFKRLPLILSTLLACALLSGRITAEEGPPASGPPGQADKKEATSVILDKVPFRATFISTHPTCAAMALDYYGVREQLKAHPAVLIGMLTNSIRRCACGREHGVWQIGQGLEKFLKDNGYQVEIREGVKASQKAEEVFTFGDYRKQIEQKRPVIVGLCRGEKAGEDLEQAIDDEGRKSLLGIGYETEGEQEAGEGRQWLIVLDPDLKVKEGEAPEPQRILWDDPAYSNIVLTFISPPVSSAAGSTAYLARVYLWADVRGRKMTNQRTTGMPKSDTGNPLFKASPTGSQSPALCPGRKSRQ